MLIGPADKVAPVKFRLRIAALRSIFLFLLLGTLAYGAPHKPSRQRDLADAVAASVILTKFAALVKAAGLESFLSSPGPFTLFVPTNSAFSKLPPGMYEDMLLPENHDQLQHIILYHLVTGKRWDAKELQALMSVPSCDHRAIMIKTTRAGTYVYPPPDPVARALHAPPAAPIPKARIDHADIRCSNGIMHQIDTLLMPPHLVLISKPDGAAPVPAPVATKAAPATAESPTTAPTAPAVDTNATPSHLGD